MTTFTWNPSASVQIASAARPFIERVCAEILADTVAVCPQDTGTLARSYDAQVDEKRGTVVGVVGTSVEYAPFVEFGTYRMRAQPHLGPALARAKGRYGS